MRRFLLPASVAALVLVGLSGARVPAAASNDPGFANQWALAQIHAPEAWTRSTGAGVRIGIVDTGVDLAHEDLGGRVVAHTSCIGSQGNPACGMGSGQDDNGHGTFVAGIAAASVGNGLGIAGVAPEAELVVAKVLDARAAGDVADITAGIRWVVDNGAQVVNVSISDGPGATASAAASLYSALEYAWSRGAVPVVAAGNSDYGSTDALVVTSTAASGSPAPSSGGLGSAKWGLAAPGGDPPACATSRTAENCIFSTTWAPGMHDRYILAAGSSAAAPHVAGVAAQLRGLGLDAPSTVQRLLETTTPQACGAGCRGVLNAAGAVGVDVEPGAAPVPAPAAARAGAGEAVAPATAPRAAPAPAPARAARTSRGRRPVADARPSALSQPWPGPGSSVPAAPVAITRPQAAAEITQQFAGLTRKGDELATTLTSAVSSKSSLPLVAAALAACFIAATAAGRRFWRALRS